MKKILTLLTLFAVLTGVDAQEKGRADFSLGADFVSSYVWRGARQTGVSVQPALGMKFKGLSISAWGNTDLFEGTFKEVDFTVAYSIAGFSVALTDYWWAGENVSGYFNYKKDTDHLWEGSLGYTLPVSAFPLSLKWNTFFAGADIVDTVSGKRTFSTYIEATYPFSCREISFEAAIGINPWNSLYAPDFSVVNLSLKATKEIKITEHFSLPVYGQLIVNPRSEGVFFVFGMRL